MEKQLLTNVEKWRTWILQKKRKVIAVICFISLCFSFIRILPKNLTISFIDVGQGDCTLITTPNHKTILIDGGGSSDTEYDVGKKVLLPYLLQHHIKQIDWILISHFDTDHSQGLVPIMKELKVKHIIIGKQFGDSENYKEFVGLVKEKNINVNVVEARQRIKIEKNLYFDILWPSSNEMINENVINNNSLICRLEYRNFSMLFTGDMEEKAEKAILQKYKDNKNMLNATVLKVAHHGSKTSSSQSFLETVQPKIALIGVGKNNTFGHPNDMVIQRLEDLRCKRIQN